MVQGSHLTQLQHYYATTLGAAAWFRPPEASWKRPLSCIVQQPHAVYIVGPKMAGALGTFSVSVGQVLVDAVPAEHVEAPRNDRVLLLCLHRRVTVGHEVQGALGSVVVGQG